MAGKNISVFGIYTDTANAERAVEGRFLDPITAADVGMHRTALDRAGPDQRHLHDKIVELARLQPG